jgi:hypothetical protein
VRLKNHVGGSSSTLFDSVAKTVFTAVFIVSPLSIIKSIELHLSVRLADRQIGRLADWQAGKLSDW